MNKITIGERMTTSTSVDVFLNEVWVGSIILTAPRYLSPKAPKWMAVYTPPACALRSTMDCKKCKGGPCQDNTMVSDCSSVEEALGALMEYVDEDMVIDFKSIVWPPAFKAGNTKVPAPAPTQITRTAPITNYNTGHDYDNRGTKPRVQIPAATPAAPKYVAPKKVSIEDALREAADHVKDGI